MSETVQAADGQARPADAIPAEANEASKIATAETINAAREKEAAAAAPVAQPDPATPPPAEPAEPAVKKLPEWAEKRISDEAFHRREAARQAKALEEENKRLAAQLAELQRVQQPPAGGQPEPQTPPPGQIVLNKADYDRAIQVEADKRAAMAQFNAECNRVAEAGKAAYPDFEDALKNLGALGALSEQNLQLIVGTGTDEGARLLYELGSKPEEAQQLLSLPPSKLAIELGKRAAQKPAKAAAPVSSAPPPVKPLDGSARVSTEPRDDMDDNEYFEKRIAQRKARRGW